ncbi:MAG: FAD-binding oxidoreductase [Desulfobacterales bacterium]
MEHIITSLKEIVGAEYVSDHAEEKYLYGRDMGTMSPATPDWVVMPDSTEAVSRIVLLANRENIPVIPMGAGLTLSGLTRPLKGGIVVDMKRMNRIIEVNEKSRYAVVEAGTSQGKLQAYLKKHHPTLKHSSPDAPPTATIAGNVLIHGSGHISQFGGFHSEMLNGVEAVMPTGEIVRLGSCATSPYWFSRSPLPDLSGLFLGWAGTTGIVTRLSVKLYPDRPFNDIRIFITDNGEHVPDVIHRLTGAQIAEDINVIMSERMPGFQLILISYSADSKKSLLLKRDLLRESVQSFVDADIGGFMPVFSIMKKGLMEIPLKSMTQFADERKGGGFEYVGAIMPIELFPEAYREGLAIAERLRLPHFLLVRIVGAGHCMMFAFAYPFNRADDSDIERVHKALEATNGAVLNMGGIPWKAEAPAQRQIIEHMDPQTFDLMNRIRAVLDPQGIMNPGNWEV